MTNPSLPGLVKIGYTTRRDVNTRLKEFDQAGLPYPYEKAYALWVAEPRGLEQRVHQSLTIWRENKEWFRCSVEKAKETIEQLAQYNVALLDEKEETSLVGQEEEWLGYSEEPNRRSGPPHEFFDISTVPTSYWLTGFFLLLALLAFVIELLEALSPILTSPLGDGLLAVFFLLLVILFFAVLPSLYQQRLKKFSEEEKGS